MYKKFFLFGFMALLGFSSMAQDIIMLKTGDDIEALVEKVGEVETFYKEWNKQTGPVHVVRNSEVFMIKYQNGLKVMFNTAEKNVAQPQVKQVEQAQQPSSVPVTPSASSTLVTPLTPSTPLTPLTTSSSNLQNEFYRIGDDDKAMLEFFRRTDSEYYNRFDKACKGKRSANAWLGIGLGASVVGGILLVSGVTSATKANESSSIDDVFNQAGKSAALINAGGAIAGIGNLLIIISIPTYAVAASRKKAIKNDFAKEYFGITSYTYQPKLNFGTTANGIGLTFNF